MLAARLSSRSRSKSNSPIDIYEDENDEGRDLPTPDLVSAHNSADDADESGSEGYEGEGQSPPNIDDDADLITRNVSVNRRKGFSTRDVSNMTTIRMEDQAEDPFGLTAPETILEEDIFASQYERDDSPFDVQDTRRDSGRTFSTMPDEIEIPHNFEHLASGPNSSRYSTPRAPKAAQARPSPTKTFNSSPRHIKSSPVYRQSRDVRQLRHETGFRKASSLFDVQTSSPPAMTESPRSARHRGNNSNYNSRAGTPSKQQKDQSARNTPVHPHPNPKKEYPLILLHCSITPSAMPYSPEVLRSVLPSSCSDALTLLRDKLGPTVLERGILIPHPGEDFELLEERVLETLELKKPRIGSCGHFNAPSTHSATLADAVASEPESSLDEYICSTCGFHIIDHDGADKDFDIKLYAANGLMRAGAWCAAWREMEQVDLEIALHLPDDVKRDLEEAQKQEDAAADCRWLAGEDIQPSDDLRGADIDRASAASRARSIPPEAPEPPRARSAAHVRSESALASVAHSECLAEEPVPVARPADSGGVQRSPSRHEHYERLPLSTLLLNYVKNKLLAQPGLLFQLALGAITLAYWLSPQKLPAGDRVSAALTSAPVLSAVPSMTVTVVETSQVEVLTTATVTQTVVGSPSLVEQLAAPTSIEVTLDDSSTVLLTEPSVAPGREQLEIEVDRTEVLESPAAEAAETLPVDDGTDAAVVDALEVSHTDAPAAPTIGAGVSEEQEGSRDETMESIPTIGSEEDE